MPSIVCYLFKGRMDKTGRFQTCGTQVFLQIRPKINDYDRGIFLFRYPEECFLIHFFMSVREKVKSKINIHKSFSVNLNLASRVLISMKYYIFKCTFLLLLSNKIKHWQCFSFPHPPPP